MDSIEMLKKSKLTLILGIVVIFLLAYVFYETFYGIAKSKKIYKLKNKKKSKKDRKDKKKKKTIFSINTKKVKKKLIQSGYPLSSIGFNEYNYYGYKIVVAIISLISKLDRSLIFMISYGMLGFFIIDVFINMKKKKRDKEIEYNMPKILEETISGIERGESIYDILRNVQNKISSKSFLYTEFKYLSNKVMQGDTKKALRIFRYRLGNEDIDTYCFSLLQMERGGNVVGILRKQLELNNTKKMTKKKIEKARKGNYGSVATGLVVAAILLMIVFPLMEKLPKLNF